MFVSMALSVLALCALAVAVVVGQPPEPTLDKLVAGIPFDAPNYAKVIFSILNNNADKELSPDDLHDEYYLAELQAEASNKFVKVIDGPDKDTTVNVNELAAFLSKPQVKLALYECVVIKSQALENLCFRDQIANYVLLVLDDIKDGSTTEFFKHLEDPKDSDEAITESDLKLKSITNPQTQANLLREMGAGCGKKVDQKAFDEYITHEDFGPHFRICKTGNKNEKTGLPDYDEECLTKELVDFVDHHFTELDLASVFNYLDTNNDGIFDAKEIGTLTGASQEDSDWFIHILDDQKDNMIHYGEFRSIFRLHSHFRRTLSKGCMANADQASQETCFQQNVKDLIKSHPVPRLLLLPDLDVVFIFEDLDKTNDGKIVAGELGWDATATKNFISEVDGPDDGDDVDLDEFMKYTKMQHMVYGIGDCMDKNYGNERLQCYEEEYKKIMGIMFLEADVKAFFEFVERPDDKDNVITIEDLKDPRFSGLTDEQANYLLLEMGMGDKVITYEEFQWFVKQEELLKKYNGMCKPENHADIAKNIWEYVDKQMTEYDIQYLFYDIDEDHNMELTAEDFKKDAHCATLGDPTALISALDRDILLGLKEPDTNVNFLEWWLFFNTPINNNRRDNHFDKCAADHDSQEKEFECYKTKLFDASIY